MQNLETGFHIYFERTLIYKQKYDVTQVIPYFIFEIENISAFSICLN